MKLTASVVGAILFFACQSNAADPVYYSFSGTLQYDPVWISDPSLAYPDIKGHINKKNPFGDLHAGMTIQGYFSYDPNARQILDVPWEASYRSGPEPGIYDPVNPYYIHLEVGDKVFDTFNTDITITNYNGDRYAVIGSTYYAETRSYIYVTLQFGDADGELYDSTDLPDAPPSLDMVDYAFIDLIYTEYVPGTDVYYQPLNFSVNIDSLEPMN